MPRGVSPREGFPRITGVRDQETLPLARRGSKDLRDGASSKPREEIRGKSLEIEVRRRKGLVPPHLPRVDVIARNPL